MEKAKGDFFHFLQIQMEKLTLLLKKVFLMSISMKNGKKSEKRHPASGNVLREAGGSAAGSRQGTRRAGLCHGLSCRQNSQPGPSGKALMGPR